MTLTGSGKHFHGTVFAGRHHFSQGMKAHCSRILLAIEHVLHLAG